MINEGGNEGWERFRKRQGKTLKKILNKMRKQEKNKALQFKRFGSKKVAKDAVRARESFGEGIGAAYMPKAGKAGVPEREITSKAVRKQLNRNRNRAVMKGDLETPHVRYVHSRDKSTDYIRPERKKRRFKKKMKEEYPPGAEADMKRLYKHKTPSAKDMDAMYRDHKKSEQERKNAAKLKKVNMVGQSSPHNESFGDRGMSLQELGDPNKMNQLFRMGLAKKGELQLMQRMMKRGPDALKDPKLRQKMYDLLVDLTDLVTKDGQTFVKVRQNVQKNKKELQAVKELLHYGGQTILEVNTAYKLINIPEDMSGMSVSSGHKRSVKQGAGMTKKGVAAYRRRNPGSKLQTAVTTPPSKLKKGSKAAKRRKAFCSRSRSWTGERGKAARRRWNC